MCGVNIIINSSACWVTPNNASDYRGYIRLLTLVTPLAGFIIRSTCNSRDTLLSEALIYRLRGHYKVSVVISPRLSPLADNRRSTLIYGSIWKQPCDNL